MLPTTFVLGARPPEI